MNNPTMNDPSEMPTPRTDAERGLLNYKHKFCKDKRGALVPVGFAKQLERDLSTLRKAAEAARVALEELLKLRKNCEGDIGWRGQKDAVVDYIRVKHILTIESALASLRSELEKKTNPATPETPAPHLD